MNTQNNQYCLNRIEKVPLLKQHEITQHFIRTGDSQEKMASIFKIHPVVISVLLSEKLKDKKLIQSLSEKDNYENEYFSLNKTDKMIIETGNFFRGLCVGLNKPSKYSHKYY